MHGVRRKCPSVCCSAHDEVHYVLFVTSTASDAAWVGRNAAMLHGVAMETAGNGGESARQRMCIKFCHFITYCRTPRACKLWRGTQKHSLLTWKNHFTRSYEEWMNFSSEAPRLWRFFSLFRGDKMLKGARADIARTRSQKQQISKFITVADIFLYRHHNADNVCKNSKTRHDGGFKMQPWLHLLSSDGQRWTIYCWFSSSTFLLILPSY